MSPLVSMLLLARLAAAPPAGDPELARAALENPELAAVRQRLAEDRVRLRFFAREEASLLGGLTELERGIEVRRRQAAAHAREVAKLERELVTLDRRLSEAGAALDSVRAQAGRRASALLRLRRTRLAELLRHARTGVEVRRLRERLRAILAHDASLVERMRAATVADARAREALGAERARLAAAREALGVENEAALELRAERAALLAAMRAERRGAERVAAELAAAARRLEAEVGVVRGAAPAPAAAPGGFAAQRGKLPWPAPGKVEVAFGKKVDPASGMVVAQKGLDLRAAQSTPVRAVFAGRVAFAAWLDGYGRLAILDHGDGYFSLYAHLESFAVQAGEQVAQHQVLGVLGDSGSTKGAYLYLELRKGKEPLDPQRWLAP